jgi:hypothetical protein
MTPATLVDPVAASQASRQPARQFWLQRVGYGLLLGASIAVLELAYYYPLVSTPEKLRVVLLGSLLFTWCGDAVLLALTVALFERWKAPRLLTARQLALAVAIGSVAGVLAWEGLVQFVFRERFGILLFVDYVGQPVTLAGVVLYHTWLIFVFGGLAAAVYASRQRHARMLAVLRAAELSRETSQQRLAAARLAALHTRIDPKFLFQTLTKLEQLYETDPSGADRLLEELIVFLRRALAGIQVSSASSASDRRLVHEQAFQAK